MNDTIGSSAPSQVTTQPPAEEPDADDVAQTARTPEEVEAQWKYRLSQKDKAHAAAEAVLQAEIESLRQRATPSAPGQPSGDASREAELERQLEAERNGRLIDARRAKYPFVAALYGNDESIFTTSEVGLAKLNSQLEEVDARGGSTVMAPTNPKRSTASPPKAIKDKSKEELLDDLKRVAPAYQEWLRQNS